VTNSFERISKVLTLLALLFAASVARAQTATINWSQQHQPIQGFGAADQLGSFAGQTLTSSQAQLFFSQTNGIGLSILREAIPDGSGGGVPGDCSSVQSSCVPSATLNNMQLALSQNSNLRIFGTPWSPPASMKTNGSVDCTAGSGSGSLLSGSYGSFASWISNWASSLRSIYNITPYAVSPQNEPEECLGYDSSEFSAAAFQSLIGSNLGPAMSSSGNSNTLIMMPETSIQQDLGSYGDSCLNDSGCSQYVGIVATHNYDFGSAQSSPSSSKQYWMTEISGCVTSVTSADYAECAYSGAMNPDGLYWAYNIWSWMTQGNANAWVWWALIPFNSGYANTGLMNADGATIPQRLWAVGNYSKFIQPGYYRIDCPGNPQNGILLSCYQSTSTNTLVLVAINNGGSSISQTFSIANGPNFTSVMPWITSASQNLAQQSAVTVNSNSFSYSLPASSVTTFVGSAGSSPPSQSQNAAPAPPVITSIAVK
jgi:glucuronoarabinoxylan endo-1,4-beta-xylanase